VIVEIQEEDGVVRASLSAPLDLQAFSVSIGDGTDVAAVAPHLEGTVRFEGADQAWVSCAWLELQAPFRSDEVALDGLRQMFEYARGKGWLDDARGEVAGHVVRRSD
jgi:hypothetical protein